jgi:hypothetical protein
MPPIKTALSGSVRLGGICTLFFSAPSVPAAAASAMARLERR